MKTSLTRRQFLKFSAISLSPLALGRQHPSTLAAARPAKGNRPNIIFLMSDQQRWDCVGRVNPAVKTPALDSLARDGIFFDQATCQGPMCVPSRYSMMLGLYPSQVGVLTNAMQLPDERLPAAPLPEILRKAGYQTAGFGKTHWGAKGCSTRGFETRFIGQPRNSRLYEDGAVMMSDLNQAGLDRYNAEAKAFGGGEENIAGYIGCTSKVPEKDHRDGWVCNQCLGFIDSRLDPERPLFLYLSFIKPHAGHNVPSGYEELYNINEMPIPEQPPIEKVEPCHATGTNREKMYRTFWSKADKTQWRQMILRYRANCSWIDSMFARVISRLKAKGLLGNSLVIYASDHGEMLGERYYRFNKYCLFESSVRVPIILSGTAVPESLKGTIDHRPAELLDIMPTVLKAAGLEADPAKPGKDLLAPPVKSATFCELHTRRERPAYMWRNNDYKLILVMDKTRTDDGFDPADILAGELYDLKNDPVEWNNLFSDDKYAPVRRRMTAALINHLQKYAAQKGA